MLRGIKLTVLLLAIIWLAGYLAWREGVITPRHLEPVAASLESHLGSKALTMVPQMVEWGAWSIALLLPLWLLVRLGIGLGRVWRRRCEAHQALQEAVEKQTVTAYEQVFQVGDKGLFKPRKVLRRASAGRQQQLEHYAQELGLFAALLRAHPAPENPRSAVMATLCDSLQQSLQGGIAAENRKTVLIQPLRLDKSIYWRAGTGVDAQKWTATLEEITQSLGEQADKTLEHALGDDFDWRNLVEPEQVRQLERPGNTLQEAAQQLPGVIQSAVHNLTEPRRSRRHNAPPIDWSAVRSALTQRIKVDFIRRAFTDRGWYAKSYEKLREQAQEPLRRAANQLWPEEQELFKETHNTTQAPSLIGTVTLPVPAFGDFRFWGDKRNEATLEPLLEMLQTQEQDAGAAGHSCRAGAEVMSERVSATDPDELFSQAFVSLLIQPFHELCRELRRALTAAQQRSSAPSASGGYEFNDAAAGQLSAAQISALEQRLVAMEAALGKLDAARICADQGVTWTAQASANSVKPGGGDVFTAGRGRSEPKSVAKESVTISFGAAQQGVEQNGGDE